MQELDLEKIRQEIDKVDQRWQTYWKAVCTW